MQSLYIGVWYQKIRILLTICFRHFPSLNLHVPRHSTVHAHQESRRGQPRLILHMADRKARITKLHTHSSVLLYFRH